MPNKTDPRIARMQKLRANKKTPLSLAKIFLGGSETSIIYQTLKTLPKGQSIVTNVNNPLIANGTKYILLDGTKAPDVKISALENNQFILEYVDGSNEQYQYDIKLGAANELSYKKTKVHPNPPKKIHLNSENLSKQERQLITNELKTILKDAKQNKKRVSGRKTITQCIDGQDYTIILPAFIIRANKKGKPVFEVIGKKIGAGATANVHEIDSVGFVDGGNDFVIKERRTRPDYVQEKNTNRRVVKISEPESNCSLKPEYEYLKETSPNYVKKFGRINQAQYIIMHRYEKQDLATYIEDITNKQEAQTPLTQDEQERIIYIMSQLVDLMVMLAEKKISHQDLKPDNIFVESDGKLMLGDFGFSREKDDLSRKVFMGSPAYTEPTFFDKSFGVRHDNCDIYALGVIFTQLLGAADMGHYIPSEVVDNFTLAKDGKLDWDSGLAVFKQFAHEKEQYFEKIKNNIGLDNSYFNNGKIIDLIGDMLNNYAEITPQMVKERFDNIIALYDEQYAAANNGTGALIAKNNIFAKVSNNNNEQNSQLSPSIKPYNDDKKAVNTDLLLSL